MKFVMKREHEGWFWPKTVLDVAMTFGVARKEHGELAVIEPQDD